MSSERPLPAGAACPPAVDPEEPAFLPYGRQEIDEADLAVVADALGDPMITQGPRVQALEDAVREYTGAAHAIAFSSGTAALHGAAFACDLGPGSAGVVPTLTFAASANCLRYVGAEPHFVDIDRATLNIDPEAAVRVARERPEVGAIVAVSFAGLPVDIEPLRAAGVPVIEDGCHALGANRGGARVGGPGGAHITAFSMHPVKAITSGEGGMLTTEDEELALRARRFREHGIDRHPAGAEGPWAYDIVQDGLNYRLTDFQSALATSQLAKLDGWIERRNGVASLYRQLLADEDRIELPPAAPRGSTHAYHLFPIRIRAGAAQRLAIFEGLRAVGVGVQVHYIPLNRFSLFSTLPAEPTPNAKRYYSGAISLPVFPGMRPEDGERVVRELLRLLDETGADT